jgi:hypothetical protein
VENTQKRVSILKEQIAVAGKLRGIDESSQELTWLIEMVPLLEKEEQLDSVQPSR